MGIVERLLLETIKIYFQNLVESLNSWIQNLQNSFNFDQHQQEYLKKPNKWNHMRSINAYILT